MPTLTPEETLFETYASQVNGLRAQASTEPGKMKIFNLKETIKAIGDLSSSQRILLSRALDGFVTLTKTAEGWEAEEKHRRAS